MNELRELQKKKDAFNFNFEERKSAEGWALCSFTSFQALTTRVFNFRFWENDTHLLWFVLNLLHFEKNDNYI